MNGQIGLARLAGFRRFNLRCPRNGKRTSVGVWPLVKPDIPLSSLATERFEHALGKAMKVAPSARIPANKVSCRVDFSAHCL